MKRYDQHISLALSVIISNVWLLDDGAGNRFIIDTGHRLEIGALSLSLLKSGVTAANPPKAILVTHRHSDHAGNAAILARRLGCDFYCPEADITVLTGNEPAPKIRRGLGNKIDEALCWVEDNFPITETKVKPLPPGEWDHEIEIIPAYGHTEGSSMIYHRSSQTLFTGDILLAGDPPSRFWIRLQPAIRPYSIDVGAAHRALLDFINKRPPISRICSGHGPFIGTDAEKLLDQLGDRMTKKL